jgi:hypothetical protein
MKLRFDFSFLSCDYMGENGVSDSDFSLDSVLINDIFEKVLKNKDEGSMKWTSLFKDEKDLNDILTLAEKIKKSAEFP